MSNRTTQNLRSKLERRYLRLRSVSFGAFQYALQDFWRFFDEEPNLIFLETQLENSKDEHIKKLFTVLRETSLTPFSNLRVEIINNVRPYELTHMGNQNETDNENLKAFKEKYIEPFYFYLDEQIDNQRVVLSFILRYKYRSEWFNQDKLWGIYENEKKRVESNEKKHAFVEDRLASDL